MGCPRRGRRWFLGTQDWKPVTLGDDAFERKSLHNGERIIDRGTGAAGFGLIDQLGHLISFDLDPFHAEKSVPDSRLDCTWAFGGVNGKRHSDPVVDGVEDGPDVLGVCGGDSVIEKRRFAFLDGLDRAPPLE